MDHAEYDPPLNKRSSWHGVWGYRSWISFSNGVVSSIHKVVIDLTSNTIDKVQRACPRRCNLPRQHATPLIVSSDGGTIAAAVSLGLGIGGHGFDEAVIQDLVHRFPACLPIAEIDSLFCNPVAICRELSTPAGPVDNLLVTPSGLPVLVECKLWRNPEGRREVIGQILDYSKELTRWSASDLQREASRQLKKTGNTILSLIQAAGHDVDEVEFNDALTANLRRGRFLLLVVGDGIREGVEAIAEYLQAHAGLHFTFGLVEMPIYLLPDGSRVIVPRVLARTQNILRTVVSVPDGFGVAESEGELGESILSPHETPEKREGRERRNATRRLFWSDFLDNLKLDDPDQPRPKPSLGGHIEFSFGAPGGSSWLTIYRNMRANSVGLFLSGNVGSAGEQAMKSLSSQQQAIREELGLDARVDFSLSRAQISAEHTVQDLESEPGRSDALAWLQERTNTFINVLRPRLRSALEDIQAR